MRRRGEGRMLAVACVLVAAVAVSLTACTATRPATPATVARPTPVPAASLPPGAPTGAGPYLVVAGGSTQKWADARATLRPIATTRGHVVSPQTAYSSIRSSFENIIDHQMLTAEPTAQLVSYSNSAFGFTTPSGVTTIEGRPSPVWVFRIPVAQRDFSWLGVEAPPVQPLGGCEAYFVTAASTGELLTAGQHCNAPGLAAPGVYALPAG